MHFLLTTYNRYIKSSDVQDICDELLPQIGKLLEIRKDPTLKDEENRVDVVLDDVFQLLSLAFLTVGLNRTVPATFASLSTVRRLLEHLQESKIYSDNDTKPIRKRLDDITAIVNEAVVSDEPQEIIGIFQQKLKVCYQVLEDVEKTMKEAFAGLKPMLRKLVTIKREILAIGSKPKFSPSAFEPLREKLVKIENERVDGNFVSEDGSVDVEGQGPLNGLLEECYNLLNDFTVSSEPTKNYIPEGLRPTYDELTHMKAKLENLLVTHRWTLRETDLYSYQRSLETIEKMRKDGEFSRLAEDHPRAQTIILYLVRRCYAIIYKLLESSEPVSESLIPIHNQLSTVRRCLLEVQRVGGVSSVRELYPYQMKLASIDDLRVDGKFMVGGSVPEGQGMLNALLAECFDLTHELQMQIREASGSSTPVVHSTAPSDSE